MPTTLRAIVAAGLLVLLLLSAHLGTWIPADAKLWELRFAAADRAPSGEIILIDIDSSSLAEIGTWPWPRALHGRLLDQLMARGAYEVAFDIDFSTSSTRADDTALAESLERAGGYAYLATFRQSAVSGTEVWNHPIAQFGAFAKAALVNVDSLEAGMVWSLPGKDPDQGVQSIAGHFNPHTVVPDTLRIDYSIDLERIVRIPASAVLSGTLDPDLVRDRQVVVGASAIELHDLLIVPRFGVIPGAIVQIAAVETLKQGRSLTHIGSWPAIGLSILFVVGSLVLPRLKLGWALAVSTGAGAMLEVATMAFYVFGALQVDTSLFHVTAAGTLLVRLLEDRVLRRRQLRAQHARLLYLADHDEQTGALSQSAWFEAIANEKRQAERLDILLLRVEQLDNAGASLGFRVADQAIGHLYKRLIAADRGPVGRIESSAFALAIVEPFAESDLHELIRSAEAPYWIEGHQVVVRLRWGKSVCYAQGSAETGLQEARTGLAMAMRKNLQGMVYSPEFDAELSNRRQVDILLRSAVAKHELELAFQVQVDVRSGQATGVEALLRWNSRELGKVSPADFIPLAEENGTIIELGSWVAHEACRQAMENGWKGRVSINVSPAQMQKSDIVSMIRSALAQTGFPAEQLDVEITESLVAVGEASILETLSALRDLGVSIAIDDFGTGFSSLSYLATLPIDKLKIDQSFVRQMRTPRGAEVIRAISDLGRKLGLVVVAEGVETDEEFRVLAELQCDTVQGFLFGRPGPLPRATHDATEAAA